MKIIILIFILIFSINGYADSVVPPEPYVLESSDSKLRFVMLTWTAVQTEDGKVYNQSGMYPIDDESEPIWSINWYADDVYLSRDGAYLVNTGPWATDLSDIAVAFYHNGKLLHEYKISDLLTDKSAIVRTISHFFWAKTAGFDDINNTYLIVTHAGDKYLFDISTGEITKKSYETIQSDSDTDFAQAIKQFKTNHSWFKSSVKPLEKPIKATTIIPDSEFIPISSGRECEEKLAGEGRHAKAICYDLINIEWRGPLYEPIEWRGPLMVVIPANGGEVQKSFAIGKYEVSIGDYSRYCTISGKCNPVTDKTKFDEPQAGISLQQAEEYIQWLSKRTGKRYRLPTYDEWEYAAYANGDQPRRDFNCRLVLGDKIKRGTGIVSVNSGSQNAWGLKNYIGNVQEWVIEPSGKILALGGYYKLEYEKCSTTYSVEHSSEADDVTGFRVLMEIE